MNTKTKYLTVVSLLLCLITAFLLIVTVSGSEVYSPVVLYVSEDGNDVTGDGSVNNPYLSLQKAYEKIDVKGIIYLLSDITLDDNFYFNKGKEVTLSGIDRHGNPLAHKITTSASIDAFTVSGDKLTVTYVTFVLDNAENIARLFKVGESEESLSELYLEKGTTLINNCGINIDGGLVFVSENAYVELNGAELTGNVNDNSEHIFGHGSVYIDGGEFVMNSGKISQNRAMFGAGIYFANGKLSLNGGAITRNFAKYDGGAVYIAADGAVLSGNLDISENKNASGDSNIYIDKNFVLKLEDNISGTIGISVDCDRDKNSSVLASSEGKIQDNASFVSDDKNIIIDALENEVILKGIISGAEQANHKKEINTTLLWVASAIGILVIAGVIIFVSFHSDDKTSAEGNEYNNSKKAETPVSVPTKPTEEKTEPQPVIFEGETIPAYVPGTVVKKVSAEIVDRIMTNEQAVEVVELKGEKREGKMTFINVDTLCDNFDTNEHITLDRMKEKGLIADKYDRVKILARGIIDKPINVEADAYSVQAVKMIVLTGGKVTKIG